MGKNETIGFIGLGVMGGPMCRNIATKHDGRVVAFDLSVEALDALADTKVERAESIADLAKQCDTIFLSLPGGAQVKEVCSDRGLAAHMSAGSVIVDLSTTAVSSAREVAADLEKHNIAFADAPVARTREAAQKGQLSIMVGAADDVYDQIHPLLAYMATDITHGGGVGTGQVLKLVNNMLVFEHVAVLAEMMVLGEKAGVAPETLLDAVSKGSGDSFVLRNHGRKSMLPRTFPDKAFSPEYALKDIGYVLELAQETGVSVSVAEHVKGYYEAAIEQGFGGQYFPSVIEVVAAGGLDKKEDAK